MAESENLVVNTTTAPVVQDRTEVQLSDGGAGDWGENADK